MPKINRIIAKPARGVWKDKNIEVEFGNSYENTVIKVNGKKLKNVIFVGIKCRVGGLTTLVIEKYPEK